MPGPGAVPILVVGYVVVEVMGGLRPGSLSLLTDAVQMFVNAPRLRAGQADGSPPYFDGSPPRGRRLWKVAVCWL